MKRDVTVGDRKVVQYGEDFFVLCALCDTATSKHRTADSALARAVALSNRPCDICRKAGK